MGRLLLIGFILVWILGAFLIGHKIALIINESLFYKSSATISVTVIAKNAIIIDTVNASSLKS